MILRIKRGSDTTKTAGADLEDGQGDKGAVLDEVEEDEDKAEDDDGEKERGDDADRDDARVAVVADDDAGVVGGTGPCG